MVRLGRPKTENPKNIRLEIRLTEAEAIKLQYCAERLNTNRTGVLMQGLRLMGIRKEVRHMNADEARKKSEMGAIKNIENLTIFKLYETFSPLGRATTRPRLKNAVSGLYFSSNFDIASPLALSAISM